MTTTCPKQRLNARPRLELGKNLLTARTPDREKEPQPIARALRREPGAVCLGKSCSSCHPCMTLLLGDHSAFIDFADDDHGRVLFGVNLATG